MTDDDSDDLKIEQCSNLFRNRYKGQEIEPPRILTEKIKDMAEIAAIKLRDKQNAPEFIEESFMSLAAADGRDDGASKLISQSGSIQLHTMPDDENVGSSYIVIEFLDEAYRQWQGQEIEVRFGEVIVYRGILDDSSIMAEDAFPKEVLQQVFRIGPTNKGN